MRRLLVPLCGLILFLSLALQAQQPGKVWRITLLTADRPGTAEAFVEAMRDLSYVEGRHFVLDRRSFSDLDRLPAVSAEIVRTNPDVIVAGHGTAAWALKSATQTIPIVVASSADAVAQGLVASLARPGGNVTGLTNMAPDLAAKRLEILREVAPRAVRIAIVGCPDLRGKNVQWSEIEPVGRRMGLELVQVAVRSADELPGMLDAAQLRGIQAVLVQECSIFPSAAQVTAAVSKTRLPAVYPSPRYPAAGGLIGYGPNGLEQWRRSAVFVDKILKGAKPADLPVEQPSRFELVVNQKTAKALGLTIPPKLVQRADSVIE